MGDALAALLLVEDNAIIGLAEKQQLERVGYSVDVVTTGLEAIDRVAAPGRQIDLILMDVDLGEGIDGTETATRILAHTDLPIVFLSSHTEPEYLQRIEKITTYGFVEKGGKTSVLDASIRMALRLFEARMDRERTHQELLESERRYRHLFENLDEEVHLWKVVRDEAGAIESWELVDANPVALAAWGCERDEVIGRRADEIWPNADPISVFKPVVDRVFAERSVYSWEETFAGTGQTLLMTTVSFDEYFFSVGRDISRFREGSRG